MTPESFFHVLEAEAKAQQSEQLPSHGHGRLLGKAWHQARDWAVLRMRERGWTYSQIGECVGVSPEQVRQIINSALRRADRLNEVRWRQLYEQR